jgi:hypothetical protein
LNSLPLLATICGFARATFQTRDGAQILVNGAKIVVGHVLVDRPGHDLQKASIEGRRDATNTTLPPDGQCFITVTFGPETNGPHHENLDFPNSNSEFAIPFSGTDI